MDEFLIPIDNQKDKEKQNALNANNQNANSSFNTQNNALNASLNTQNNNLQNTTNNNQNVNSNLNSQTSIDNTQNPQQNNITAYDGYLLDKFGKGLNVKAKQDVDFKSRSINEPINR